MRPDLEQLLEASYRTVVCRDLRTDEGGAADARQGGRSGVLLRRPYRAASIGPDVGRIHPSPLSAEPPVQAERERLLPRVSPWLHGRLPGRADREGRHALPHLGAVVWMVVVDGATHGYPPAVDSKPRDP